MTITDERALELLRENFCEPQGWYWCSEYGEPGYSHDGDQVVLVMGDYWCRCKNHPHAGKPKYGFRSEPQVIQPEDLHDHAAHHPLLWARFEEVASFEWHDEWVVDHDNDKAYRTTGDCYAWVPSTAYSEYGDILTPDSDIIEWIEHAIEERRALNDRQVRQADIIEAGFERYPDDDTFYESGWHPGQTDDPNVIIDAANEAGLDAIVFVTGQGQFDTRWVVYTRPREEDE